MRAKILFSVIFGVMAFSTVGAQSYYWNGYYGNGNNPNNGVVSFQPGYDSYYPNYNNYQNYNSGYYNYSEPVSVNVGNYGYYNNYYNYNNGYYNNYPYYNSYYSYTTLAPTTYAATNARQSTATINGYVTVSGSNYNNQTFGTTWFQYGVSPNSLNWSTSPANVYYSTYTNAYLTGLNCGATYYFRAVTSGQNGLQYGTVLSFTTSSCNYAYYGYNNYYPTYNYQTWQPPNIPTYCYKQKKYYR